MLVNIFGGPYAGKTTTNAAFRKQGYVVMDSEEYQREKGVNLTAWRPEHPDHAHFKEVSNAWAEKVRELLQLDSGKLEPHGHATIIITHDPVRLWPSSQPPQLHLWPGASVIAARMRKDGNPSRREAAEHWYSKPGFFECLKAVRVLSAEDALEVVRFLEELVSQGYHCARRAP